MEFIGYILAIVMGIVLGLLGGGGSILTVPILVYFFAVPAALATGYSLFIVGITSLLGSVKYITAKKVDFKVAFLFALPAMLGVFVSRKFIVPLLPDLISIASFTVSKDQLILFAFAVLVLVISVFMLTAKDRDEQVNRIHISPIKKMSLIALEGLGVGAVTGFVGAGGGFMIVPALMLLGNVPLKRAIATSLVIISMKSLLGFVTDLSEGVLIDWHFLIVFSGITLVGVVLGTLINSRIQATILRKVFAYFVFIMGVLIILKELF